MSKEKVLVFVTLQKEVEVDTETVNEELSALADKLYVTLRSSTEFQGWDLNVDFD
jgi:hypothetical protein